MQSQKDVQKTCNRDEDSFKICIMPVRSGRLYCLVYCCTNWHFVCISEFLQRIHKCSCAEPFYFTNGVCDT